MFRRILAFIMTVLLLASYTPAPAVPLLVCRMTGEPMTPVMAEDGDATCCTVERTMSVDGATRLMLTSPGCCDLLQVSERDEPPVAAVAVPPLPVAILVIQPPVVPVYPVDEVPSPAPERDQAVPRGPPGGLTCLRSPPFS